MSQITSNVLTLLLDLSDRDDHEHSQQEKRMYDFQSMKQSLIDKTSKSKSQQRLTSSAINRRKQQQQIEQENLVC